MDAARGGIPPLLVLQGVILFILGTAQVAGGMTAERDEGRDRLPTADPDVAAVKSPGLSIRPAGPRIRHVLRHPAVHRVWALAGASGVDACGCRTLHRRVFTSALLYHLTGLVTGTVAHNRRWAFLDFDRVGVLLYTVIPQMAKFGLVFFKYLTVTPVFEESLPGILPKSVGNLVETGNGSAPTVKFFNLDFSEAVFTVFSQGGLILTFIIMLCRKWRWQRIAPVGQTLGHRLFSSGSRSSCSATRCR
jgi:hypothetical protein